MRVCSLCNCESRRNCSPRGSGGPFSRCISRTQNSDGTWALSKLSCTTPILIESIIFWRCPLNNSCWEDLIDVALTNGYSLVIDIVATVYVGIKENLIITWKLCVPVWFDAKALLAISDSILNTSLLDLAAKLICQGGEQGLPFLLGLSSTQFLHLSNS